MIFFSDKKYEVSMTFLNQPYTNRTVREKLCHYCVKSVFFPLLYWVSVRLQDPKGLRKWWACCWECLMNKSHHVSTQCLRYHTCHQPPLLCQKLGLRNLMSEFPVNDSHSEMWNPLAMCRYQSLGSHSIAFNVLIYILADVFDLTNKSLLLPSYFTFFFF